MPTPLVLEQRSGSRHPVTRRHRAKLSSLKSQADYCGFGADPAPEQVGSDPWVAQQWARIISELCTLFVRPD